LPPAGAQAERKVASLEFDTEARFPVTQPYAPPGRVPHVAGERPISILVVDDEQEFCAVVSEILHIYGFDVYQANSVSAALRILEQTAPDLILTDIMMPDVDGLSLIRQLRANPAHENTPMVVLSAKASPDDLAAAREVGASGMLPKPFSVNQLRGIIETCLPAARRVPATL
jgi:CheY-like chemotaxis protein